MTWSYDSRPARARSCPSLYGRSAPRRRPRLQSERERQLSPCTRTTPTCVRTSRRSSTTTATSRARRKTCTSACRVRNRHQRRDHRDALRRVWSTLVGPRSADEVAAVQGPQGEQAEERLVRRRRPCRYGKADKKAGTTRPPNKDIDAVPTSTPDPRNPKWASSQFSLAYGDPRPHAHGPEAGTVRRVDQPLGETMRRVDDGLKSGELHLRRVRFDKGGP